MMLAEIKSRQRFEPFPTQVNFDSVCQQAPNIADFDVVSWEVYSCWKQQQADRFGGGNSAPSIPLSQRQYDGDNHFEFCEIWSD